MSEELKICKFCDKEIERNTGAHTADGFVHTACAVNKQKVEKINTEGFIGRKLTDHKNNKFNRECIEVKTSDLRASDNAHHKYIIEVYGDPSGGAQPQWAILHSVELNFQNGGLKEVGANGITDQALIAIVLDRLRSFNAGQFSSRDNSLAITHLEDALMRMERRSNDRARRGVEGERIS